MPAAARPRKKTGPKPGSRHPGMFKRGYDAKRNHNQPTDMTKFHDDLGTLCRTHVGDAVTFLADTMLDADRPDSIRLEAVTQLLDRGFGKSLDRQATLMLGQPQGQDMPMADGGILSDDQLKQIASGALQQLEAPQGLNTDTAIEGELIESKVRKKSTDN